MKGNILAVHVHFHQNGCSSCFKFLWVKCWWLICILQVAMGPYQEVERLFVLSCSCQYSKQGSYYHNMVLIVQHSPVLCGRK